MESAPIGADTPGNGPPSGAEGLGRGGGASGPDDAVRLATAAATVAVVVTPPALSPVERRCWRFPRLGLCLRARKYSF